MIRSDPIEMFRGDIPEDIEVSSKGLDELNNSVM